MTLQNTINGRQVLSPARSGLFLTAAVNQIAPGTQALAANTLRAFPFELNRSFTLSSIRSEVTTLGAATLYRIGLYTNDNDYPGTLILNTDTGTYDSSTIGLKTGTVSASISSNLIWVVIASNGAPTLRSIPLGAISNILGTQGTIGANSSFTGWTIARVFGTLPATFPTGAILISNTLAPLVALQVA